MGKGRRNSVGRKQGTSGEKKFPRPPPTPFHMVSVGKNIPVVFFGQFGFWFRVPNSSSGSNIPGRECLSQISIFVRDRRRKGAGQEGSKAQGRRTGGEVA
jgi:hypothetical protein